MDDEREWHFAMEEAVKTKMPRDIRRLYATIVSYCSVKDKQRENFFNNMTECLCSELFDDFAKEMYDRGEATEATKRARALFHIESILRNNQMDNTMIGLEQVFA